MVLEQLRKYGDPGGHLPAKQVIHEGCAAFVRHDREIDACGSRERHAEEMRRTSCERNSVRRFCRVRSRPRYVLVECLRGRRRADGDATWKLAASETGAKSFAGSYLIFACVSGANTVTEIGEIISVLPPVRRFQHLCSEHAVGPWFVLHDYWHTE